MKKASPDEIKAVRETLVACLNTWKAKLDMDKMLPALLAKAKADVDRAALPKPLTADEIGALTMKCIEGVRLLLFSMGPAPPDADKEFMKLLLFMRGMRENKKELPGEPEPIVLVGKRQKTINEYFT